MEEQAFEAVGHIELEIFWPLSIRSAWLLTLQLLKSFFPAPIRFYRLQRNELDACRRPLKNQQRFRLKSVIPSRIRFESGGPRSALPAIVAA